MVGLVESTAGPRHLRAYGNYRLGAALAGQGDREAAAGPLREAAATADQLGARLVRRWVDDLARRAHSNRQIGEALFISTKTASVHVSNILAKLGAAGRGEAAAIAYREGLVDDVA
jgi:DNA-binding NarL/FixJ family response regulator